MKGRWRICLRGCLRSDEVASVSGRPRIPARRLGGQVANVDLTHSDTPLSSSAFLLGPIRMNQSREPGSFVTTHWSLVLAAGQRALPDSAKALEALCQAYWGPVYLYVRRHVADVHEAQDLTQAFFTQLLERNILAVAQPARGRFRSFLLTSVRNFLHNEWDKQKTLKRGRRRQTAALMSESGRIVPADETL